MNDSREPGCTSSCDIFLSHHAWFDPETQDNASLYLFSGCAGDTDIDTCIARLVAAGLWSAGAVKKVRDDQRAMYAQQLEPLERVAVRGTQVSAGRFNHPKYPSSATQWQAWVQCLNAG